MKSEAPTAGAGSPIRLNTSIIADGKFFQAGSEIPFSEATLPEHLKPFVEIGEDDADGAPPGPPTLNFQSNVVYDIDPAGHILSRAGRRQAAQLAGEAYAQQQAEEAAIAAGALDPETQAALEDAHAVDIGLQIKAAEVAQARRDAEVLAAQRDAEEAAARAGEPAKPSPLFVRRGAIYRRTDATRLRAGEQIFTRQPNGQWWVSGIIDANGELPPPPEVL